MKTVSIRVKIALFLEISLFTIDYNVFIVYNLFQDWLLKAISFEGREKEENS